MGETILCGRGRQMTRMPRDKWEQIMSRVSKHTEERCYFKSEEHHLVQNFVVREIPNVGEPLTQEFIAQELGLQLSQLKPIIDDLEKNLTFLFRNKEGYNIGASQALAPVW